MELNGSSIENLINQFNEQNNFMGESYNDNAKPSKYYLFDELKNIFLSNNVEISVLHVNIVSLIKNFNKLELLLSVMDRIPDVIAISETRLKSYHTNMCVPSIDGYDFIRNDSDTSAGGVGIYKC